MPKEIVMSQWIALDNNYAKDRILTNFAKTSTEMSKAVVNTNGKAIERSTHSFRYLVVTCLQIQLCIINLQHDCYSSSCNSQDEQHLACNIIRFAAKYQVHKFLIVPIFLYRWMMQTTCWHKKKNPDNQEKN